MTKRDHSRRLSPRGIKAGIRMGNWLSNKELVPDRILCSTAKRARDTLKLAIQLWEEPPKPKFDDKLYLASVSDLLAVIAEQGKNAERLMVLGHNPGLQELVVKLVAGKPRDTREVIGKFPTGAIAHLICDIGDWSEIRADCAQLKTFMRPKALE